MQSFFTESSEPEGGRKGEEKGRGKRNKGEYVIDDLGMNLTLPVRRQSVGSSMRPRPFALKARTLPYKGSADCLWQVNGATN